MKETELIFNFPNGLPGFETYKSYKLVEDKDSALAQLIAIENNHIGFILLPPGLFFPDYKFELDEESKTVLKITKDQNEIKVLVILTNNSDISKITLNLRAPIILNISNKTGMQYILNDDAYSTRQALPLIDDMKGAAK